MNTQTVEDTPKFYRMHSIRAYLTPNQKREFRRLFEAQKFVWTRFAQLSEPNWSKYRQAGRQLDGGTEQFVMQLINNAALADGKQYFAAVAAETVKTHKLDPNFVDSLVASTWQQYCLGLSNFLRGDTENCNKRVTLKHGTLIFKVRGFFTDKKEAGFRSFELPGFPGRIRVRYHDCNELGIPDRLNINVILRQAVDDKFFLVINYIRPARYGYGRPKELEAVGIDRGTARLIAATDTRVNVDNPNKDAVSWKYLKRIARFRERLSDRRKMPKSKTNRLLHRLDIQMNRWQAYKNAYLHAASKRIVGLTKVVYAEALSMWSRDVDNRQFFDVITAGDLAKIQARIAYKLDEDGGSTYYVRPHKTSQTCNACIAAEQLNGATNDQLYAYLDGEHPDKSVYSWHDYKDECRTYTCKRCGAVYERDDNAAANILLKGQTAPTGMLKQAKSSAVRNRGSVPTTTPTLTQKTEKATSDTKGALVTQSKASLLASLL